MYASVKTLGAPLVQLPLGSQYSLDNSVSLSIFISKVLKEHGWRAIRQHLTRRHFFFFSKKKKKKSNHFCWNTTLYVEHVVLPSSCSERSSKPSSPFHIEFSSRYPIGSLSGARVPSYPPTHVHTSRHSHYEYPGSHHFHLQRHTFSTLPSSFISGFSTHLCIGVNTL